MQGYCFMLKLVESGLSEHDVICTNLCCDHIKCTAKEELVNYISAH